MKKKIINFGLLPIFVIGACVSGLLNMPKEDCYSGLALENVEALSEQYEYELVCGRNEGKCWTESAEFKICPNNPDVVYFECKFDGSPLVHCEEPC